MPTDANGAMAPVTWTVDTQMVTVGPNKTGNVVPGYEVRFTLSNGHSDSVFVAGDEYNVANVKAAIVAKAEQAVAVARLSGTVGEVP